MAPVAFSLCYVLRLSAEETAPIWGGGTHSHGVGFLGHPEDPPPPGPVQALAWASLASAVLTPAALEPDPVTPAIRTRAWLWSPEDPEVGVKVGFVGTRLGGAYSMPQYRGWNRQGPCSNLILQLCF